MLVNILLLAASTSAQYNKCNILAFEGGGSHGAYEAGVLSALTGFADPDDIRWDFIQGISTGAINTSFCSQFPIGEEQAMAQHIKYVWSTQVTGTSVVFKFWDWQIYEWLYSKPSLLDNSPLLEFLTRMNTKNPQRPVTIGTFDSNSSTYHIFNETLTISDFNRAVQASAAIPAAFPPSHYRGNVFIDGGAYNDLDVLTPIQRCLDAGWEQKDIVLDAIYDFNFLDDLDFDLSLLTPGVTQNIATKTRGYIRNLQYLITAQNLYPDMSFRYIYFPSQDLPFVLSFCPHHIRDMIRLGEYDAINQTFNPNARLDVEQLQGILDKATEVEFAE